MNYLLKTAASTCPDEFIGTTGYLVIDLASLTQSVSGHLREGVKEADATDGKGRSILPIQTNSVGMLLEVWNGSSAWGQFADLDVDYSINIGRTFLSLVIPIA